MKKIVGMAPREVRGPEKRGLHKFSTVSGEERWRVEFTTDYTVAKFNSLLSFSSLVRRKPFLLSPPIADYRYLVCPGPPSEIL
jgi:hypothetical protein